MGAIKHGDNITGKRTKLYQVWVGMRARCSDEKHISFKNYGGKGVMVDQVWNDYAVFREWAYENGYVDPLPGERTQLEIDRINSKGHYTPSNCRWTTPKENRRRTQRTFIAFTEEHTLKEWSEHGLCACDYFCLRNRIQRGWDIEEAISTPTGFGVNHHAFNWKGQKIEGRKPLKPRIASLKK